MTEFDPSESSPTENDIFLASEGFGSDSEFFSGIDGFSPGGPVPRFGRVEATPTVPAANCLDVQRNMELYIDGELVPPQQQLMDGHLKACFPCQSAHLFQTQLRTVVAEKALDHIPDEVRARIARSLGL